MWLDVDDVRADDSAIRVNRWFARHPDFVLGEHALTSGPFGETYTCLPRPGVDLEQALVAAISLLPEALYNGTPEVIDPDKDIDEVGGSADPHGHDRIREGSFFVAKNTALMQMVDGVAETITVRKGRSSDGVPESTPGSSAS